MKFRIVYTFCILILCVAPRTCASQDDECPKTNKILHYYYSVMRPYWNRDVNREFRPWRYPAVANDLETNIKRDDKFQFILDVINYEPGDISVQIIDGFVVVEAKHDERKDEHGFVSRHFVRRYPITDGVKPEEVISELSADGILIVSAPKTITEKSSKNRVVPLITTGPKRKREEKNIDKGDKNKITIKEEENTCEKENCTSK